MTTLSEDIAVHTGATFKLYAADPEQDMDALESVLNEASAWLRERGITDQWPTRFSDDDNRRMIKLREQAEAGYVYMIDFDGRPVATATISPEADPDFAHGWPAGPGDALYVMRLANTPAGREATRRFGGAISFGEFLLTFAASQVQNYGHRYLRLDTVRTNIALHNYYRRRGFELVNTIVAPGRRSGALFQRDLAPQS